MKGITERLEMHSKNLPTVDQPSLDLHLDSGGFTFLSKQMAEITRQLRHMRGEELQGLTITELQQLEKTLETGLSRVLQRKNTQMAEHISNLRKKGLQLLEENTWLRHQVAEMSRSGKQVDVDRPNNSHEDGQSSESLTNSTHSGIQCENDDITDTSLKLGLSSSGWK